MIKRLSLYISILVAAVLIISTGVYFAQSKAIVTKEMTAHANLILRGGSDGVEDFLTRIESVVYAVAENPRVAGYFAGAGGRMGVEESFLGYCSHIDAVQALRLVDMNGDIRVFIRECENLSGQEGYEPINIGDRAFFADALDSDRPVLSNFERGHLPDATKFCPSMVRMSLPVRIDGETKGVLVVNFWGERIGAVLDEPSRERGYSFIVETNENDAERDGIFLFHPKREYEFANQFGTEYRFDTIYGKETFRMIKSRQAGMFELPESGDFFAFTTLKPYGDTGQEWKIATVLNREFFFRNLTALRNNFLIVMGLSIVMSIVTASIFSRRFLAPIGGIKNALTQYADGKLDYPMRGEYPGEMQDIADAIRQMAVRLKEHIENIESTRAKMEMMNRLSSLGVMSAGIAHELNTPLNSILIVCDLLAAEAEEHGEDIATIRQEAARCVSIISNMRQLAPSNEQVAKDTVDLAAVIERTVSLLSIPPGVRLTFDTEPVELYGNPTLLQQMILNLLLNAVDAVDGSGLVHVWLTDGSAGPIMEVRDDGVGIAEHDQERIFDPFVTSKGPSGGTGLGLTLVHRIVQEHDGRIAVRSKPGDGTVVRIEFGSAT